MKQFAFVFCAGMTALLLFSGCSGINELNSALGEAAGADEITAPKLNIVKNKTTKSEIFQSIGAPGLVFRNEINGETWVYQRVAVRQTDVGFQARGNFSALFPYQANSLSHGGGIAGVGASSKVGARRSSYKTAGLMIKFNEQGCVNAYEFTATSF